MQCSATEAAALEDSGPLLQFAAQHVKKLDPDLGLAIAQARAAREANAWTPEIAQRFWSAYSGLCEAIDPVTMECLAVAQPNIARRKWFGFGVIEKISLAEQTSNLYSRILVGLLAPLLLLQFYVWTCNTQSAQMSDNFPKYQKQFGDPTAEYTKLDVATSNVKAQDWNPDQKAAAAKILTDVAAIDAQARNILEDASFLSETFLGQLISIFTPPSGRGALPTFTTENKQWYEAYQEAKQQYDRLLNVVPTALARTNLIVGICVSYVLPILFGTVGAVAYVIRAISDQITRSTFSPTSPIRHGMRVILGALAGVVVSLFNGITAQFNLPQLAIAFLAGYGVEAVFSMFDNLIQKFR